MQDKTLLRIQYLVVVGSVFLASLGAFQYYGEGLVLESEAIADEEFVFYNALGMASNYFSYSLDSWFAYNHYSPAYPFIISSAIYIYTSIVGLPKELWLANLDDLLVVGRMVSIVLFLVSLLCLRDLLEKLFVNRLLTILGLLCFVTAFGPIHLASLIRVESPIVSTTTFFLWALVHYGPYPTFRGWTFIAIAGAVPVVLEVYGAVVVGSCMLFFLIKERVEAFATRKAMASFLLMTIGIPAYILAVMLTIVRFFNYRILINFEGYTADFAVRMRSGAARLWETSVMNSVGPTSGLLETLIFFLEYLFPILVVALLFLVRDSIRTKTINWWLMSTCLVLGYWYGVFAKSSMGDYVLFPLFPLIAVLIATLFSKLESKFIYIGIVISLVGFIRIGLVQTARFNDHSYYRTIQYLLKDAESTANPYVFDFGWFALSHASSKSHNLWFRKSYNYFAESLTGYGVPEQSLILSPRIKTENISEVWFTSNEELSIGKVDELILNKADKYDYVIFDSSFVWYRNRFTVSRNPKLASKWEELEKAIKKNRTPIFETGGINSRKFIQMSAQRPAWTITMMQEFISALNDRANRASIFGPHVVLYHKESE